MYGIKIIELSKSLTPCKRLNKQKNVVLTTFKSNLSFIALKDRILRIQMIELVTKGEKGRHGYISFFLNLLMFFEK